MIYYYYFSSTDTFRYTCVADAFLSLQQIKVIFCHLGNVFLLLYLTRFAHQKVSFFRRTGIMFLLTWGWLFFSHVADFRSCPWPVTSYGKESFTFFSLTYVQLFMAWRLPLLPFCSALNCIQFTLDHAWTR